MAEKIETKRCRLPGDRNRCIVRSRFRNGTCEFSARLFRPLCDRCSTFGMTWRAVDQDSYVLDEIVQARRNTKAAKQFLIRLLNKQGIAPKRMITDKLRSYGAARRQTRRREHNSGATNSPVAATTFLASMGHSGAAGEQNRPMKSIFWSVPDARIFGRLLPGPS